MPQPSRRIVLGALAIGLTVGLAGPALINHVGLPEAHAQATALPKSDPLTEALPTGLLPEELHTVRLFKAASPAIVNVDVSQRRVDPWSRRSVEVPAGSGSGFLWDDQGHVVTNFHVIRNASSATVTFDDQTRYDATLVGVSPDHDLAVLKIDSPDGKPLTALPIGKSESLLVGQRVYAIGNPFGLDHTLTTGVVSAMDREIHSLTGRTLDGVIQTDAAINPGNSGGPLLDSSGCVVGVNTMIFSPSGASAGVGFAIPIDTVNRVVPQLIHNGKYTRPTLGIRIDDRIAAPILKQIGQQGVVILGIEPDSPADDADLQPASRSRNGQFKLGDILTAIDDRRIQDTDDLLNALEHYEADTSIKLTVWRDGDEVSIDVRLR